MIKFNSTTKQFSSSSAQDPSLNAVKTVNKSTETASCAAVCFNRIWAGHSIKENVSSSHSAAGLVGMLVRQWHCPQLNWMRPQIDVPTAHRCGLVDSLHSVSYNIDVSHNIDVITQRVFPKLCSQGFNVASFYTICFTRKK